MRARNGAGALLGALLWAAGTAGAEPQVGWYTPAPAKTGEPLTIWGSGFGTPVGKELKFGTGDTVMGTIPGAAIASWGNTQIQIDPLPVPSEGVYWIGIYEGSALQSNKMETLYVQAPDRVLVLDPDEPSSGSGKEPPSDQPMIATEDLPELEVVAPPPWEEPTLETVPQPDPVMELGSFTPPVVAWEQEFKINGSGFGEGQGQRVLRWGNAHGQSGIVSPSWIRAWKEHAIVVENRLPKSSLYGFVVTQGSTRLSNALMGLQVQDDSPLQAPEGITPNLPWQQLELPARKIGPVEPGGSAQERPRIQRQPAVDPAPEAPPAPEPAPDPAPAPDEKRLREAPRTGPAPAPRPEPSSGPRLKRVPGSAREAAPVDD